MSEKANKVCDAAIELEDEFNKSNIEQLHKVVLNFSGQSFEIKKMCVTVEIAALTLIATIFKDNYSTAAFITLLKLIAGLVPVFFYMIDLCTYYYQDKLRAQMISQENFIRQRHGVALRSEKRFSKTKREKADRIWRATINPSNMIYWGLMAIAIALLIIL